MARSWKIWYSPDLAMVLSLGTIARLRMMRTVRAYLKKKKKESTKKRRQLQHERRIWELRFLRYERRSSEMQRVAAAVQMQRAAAAVPCRSPGRCPAILMRMVD